MNIGVYEPLVKLVDIDGLKPLRIRKGEEYFPMTVPQKDSLIKYYPFNMGVHEGKKFEGDYTIYKVESVIQEIQESFNSTTVERYEVRVSKAVEWFNQTTCKDLLNK